MSKATESQNKAILAYLSIGAIINPSFALSAFKCMRLAARIYDINRQLEPAGRRVSSKMVYKENGKKYKRYWLDPVKK